MTVRARWDGDTYAENTAHHRGFDDHVLAGIQVPRDGRVLDVGCGTGDFTARLLDLVPQGQVLGVDADASMVDAARRRNSAPRLRFERAAAQELGLVQDASIDLVVSVAALHWVPFGDQALVLREVARVLRPGAVFRADLGGDGQIAAARELLDEVSASFGGPASPWTFPTVAQYQEWLDSAGLDTGADGRLRLVAQRRSLPDREACLGWLRSQVLIAYEARMESSVAQGFRAEVESRTAQLQRPDGTFDQDYVRLDVLARKG